MEEQFTLSDLVSFGNYLLGESRRHSIVFNPANGYAPTDGHVARGNGALKEVSDADLANWRVLNDATIEDLPQTNSPYQDPNEALVYNHDIPPIGLKDDHDMSQQGIGYNPSRFDDGSHRDPVGEPGGPGEPGIENDPARFNDGGSQEIPDQEKSNYDSSNSYFALADLSAEAPIIGQDNSDSLNASPAAELSGEPFDNSLEAESRRRRKGGGLVQTYPSLEEGPTFPDPEEPQEI